VTLSLLRVDDRLVHGQVVVGWVQALGAEHVVLVDDGIRASDWERELYTLGMPPGLALTIASVAEALLGMPTWMAGPQRTIVVTADVETVVRLCAVTPGITQVNVGGMHAGPGREERLPYVFMSAAEMDAFRSLEARGVLVTAQDVPTARPVPLRDLASVTA
jgi:PTS system mannose-specific IIB component/fructoselysine and glucoselysine-specific PTS system IIB component